MEKFQVDEQGKQHVSAKQTDALLSEFIPTGKELMYVGREWILRI